MKKEIKDISVTRVENGWIIRPYNSEGRFSYSGHDTFVTRTPEELSLLLKKWAKEQEQ